MVAYTVWCVPLQLANQVAYTIFFLHDNAMTRAVHRGTILSQGGGAVSEKYLQSELVLSTTAWQSVVITHAQYFHVELELE